MREREKIFRKIIFRKFIFLYLHHFSFSTMTFMNLSKISSLFISLFHKNSPKYKSKFSFLLPLLGIFDFICKIYNVDKNDNRLG